MRSLIGLILFNIIVLSVGCGVKGKPLPPEEPPTLGRGAPNFLKATENIKLDSTKPQINRTKTKPPLDDWDDEE